MDKRKMMSNGSALIDWGFAELMAFGSLIEEGFDVRLTGQDSRRGTFYHRHSVLHDQVTGNTLNILENISHKNAKFEIIDSILSEAAVLGFEYGYSIGSPDTLVIWEAQFGDFANSAQVIIDQFISSGETKWDRLCGLTLFLPHGFDGQGPEHSSARLERFLNMIADNNIQVCIPTLPSQMFHLLRRQMLRALRKPLVILTPKNLLRHALSSSSLKDFSNGQFFTVIGETDPLDFQKVKIIDICSGKLYFDILEERRKRQIQDIAVIRIEQLYPFPGKYFFEILNHFPNAKVIRWCQEEPENQGAWGYIQKILRDKLAESDTGYALQFATRPPSAAPAVGFHYIHLEQQKTVIEKSLDPDMDPLF